MKKLLSIGLISLTSLVLFSGQAFAVSNNSHSNKSQDSISAKSYQSLHFSNEKSDIVYDVADSGDNAHPSGKDRSVEKGRSLTQGKSKSNPDSNGKGPDRLDTGIDKPGLGGGVDKADQDGNNGCGNDDDFEDDNEGWCGQKPKNEEPTCENGGKTGNVCEDNKCENCGGVTTDEPQKPKTPTVLGTSLPMTGFDSNGYAQLIGELALAFSMICAGALAHLVSKYRYVFIK